MKNYYNEFKLSNEETVYATHQPYLITAIENSTGNVLELGVGEYSTDLIHHILVNTDRKIVSIEDNFDWIEKYSHNKSDNHSFRLIERSVDSWKSIVDEYATEKWGVVFVDQGYGEEIWRPSRNYSVSKLIHCSEFVVAHDADIFPEMQMNECNWIMCIPDVTPDPSRKGPPTYIFSKTKSKDFLIDLFLKK